MTIKTVISPTKPGPGWVRMTPETVKELEQIQKMGNDLNEMQRYINQLKNGSNTIPLVGE